MVRFLKVAFGLLVTLALNLTTALAVENTWDPSVQVSATVQSSPARITLSWPQDTNGVPSSYTIYRRSPNSTDWGGGSQISGSSTSYVDTNVSTGAAYEYRIVKAASSYTGYGYITAGVETSLVDARGKVVLVVDNTMASPLASELARLEADLRGDGWIVVRRDVGRSDSPASVKAAIKAVYDADPANVKSVFLFGHVPVPYSGQLNPDGHGDHIGAWPADVYYGDVDGNWTDNSVNYVQTANTDPADAARLTNVPGDGKFDQTTIPSNVELAVGRVDLSNMPGRLTWGGPASFPTETELLRKYLNKDHNFRNRITNPARRAVLGDYFGYRGGEAFAASGFRSFAPLVGASNIRNLNIEFNDQRGVWIPQAAANDYLLAYGCGAGSYATMSGLGNTLQYNGASTTEMVGNNVRGVFNLLFGSWLGDWDHEDDFLRSPLATDYGLTAVWSGRPHWFMHPMGLGATIGDITRLTQNNSGQYQTIINSSQNQIHIALMGDPTLRLHPVVPVSNLNGSTSGSTAALSWSGSSDSNIVGYHVYRASSATGTYTRLTSSPVTATNYTDSSSSSGATYMVRAVKLENASSGSYYNASQGVFWTVGGASSGGTTPPPAPAADSTAPTISLSSPAVSASLSGSVSVSANATDNVAVAGVQFKLDGANLGSEVTSAPFSTTLNTTTIADGAHTLSAVARDAAGNMASANPVSVTVLNTTNSGTAGGSGGTSSGGTTATPSTPTAVATPGTVVWLDDALPAGAGSSSTWTWITSSPAPYSGAKSLQTGLTSGLHDYGFNWGATLTPATGESIVAYVYLDPANPPREIMFSFVSDNWEHRAYWGSNDINYGTDNTAGRRYMGALPATGQWVRLEIPASAVGLENATIGGMSLSLFNGRMSLDYVAKVDPKAAATTNTPSSGATTGSSTPTTGTSSGSTTTGSTSTTPSTLWFDDAFPAGAGSSSAWNWVSSSPTPNTGSAALQTSIASGLQDYGFNWGAPLAVATGDTLVAYVYLDPANPPREIMFSFVSDNWEHRAYWGSNDISYGTDNTAGRRYMGALPATGQWARLEIPASAIGLEGASVGGFNLSVFNGRVTLDTFGKAGQSSSSTTTGSTTTTTSPATTPSTTPTVTNTLWFDDALPAGAGSSSAWTWVSSSPTPNTGSAALQTQIASGLHDYGFNWGATLSIGTGEALVAYVYLDPANPPSEVMLSYVSDNWEHRAYWGTNNISYGTDNTAGRRYMGALPAAGQWARLEIPASAIGLEGASVAGMGLSVYNGRVTIDTVGKASAVSTTSSTSSGSTTTTTTPPSTTTSGGTTTTSGGTTTTSGGTSSGSTTTTAPSTTTTTVVTDTAWFDDALPLGVSGSATGGDGWLWVASNPAPYSGTVSHQSNIKKGQHEHSFNFATQTLSVAAGDKMFVYVYLDPANVPAELMVSWCSDNWEHRAYWGTDKINYGTANSPSRYNAGALPAAGQWVRLEVPASAVGLEGQSVQGMTFSLYNGRASWDATGKATVTTVTVPSTDGTASSGGTSSGGTSSGGTSSGGTSGGTSSGGTSSGSTTTTPPASLAENTAVRTPQVGDYQVRVLTPTMLELQRITTKQPDPATVTEWNFVDSSGNLSAPATSEFAVTINGSAASVQSVGFRRRVAYAPLNVRDLRIDNCLYLQLATPVADGATVEVKNPSGALWPSSMQFKVTADTLRYSPAIHVNQEGYVPNLSKKAMVGYYLGSKGELSVDTSVGFKLVNAATGATAFTGTLTPRKDVGFAYSPMPYQGVLQADFTSFTAPGEYQLVVPGMGASLPFLINDGVAMAFLRTYELGLYHQRSGTTNALPYTRFTHDADHMLPAEIPSPASNYAFTWTCIASKNEDAKTNPRHTAPRLDSEAAQLYPFVNKGTVDVSGGHFDAGDWSKYTINVGQLVHELLFTADSIQGNTTFDNLGVPESGDGISDIMQEAKREADYLAKLQDGDGGFYFIVYPKTREYEGGNPAPGDQQVVWPKNTSATAVGVAALAEMASSPKFKTTYPAEAAAYLAKAKSGWQFLMNAINKYGKDGSYQKITFYGDRWMHDDELAWAAAAMFAATGEAQYHNQLKAWFPNPSDGTTWRDGWVRLAEGWGNAIRTYAFAARSGRLSAGQLDANYLGLCENEIKAAGDDVLTRSNHSAYGTALADQAKSYLGVGWYFTLDQASDMAAAYQLNPKPEYIDALVGNMNYEGGSNPVNVMYITGLGMKRQREIVNQYAQGDRRVLPPDGIPFGSVQSAWSFLQNYGASGNELFKLSFPSDETSAAVKYPFYDRWADTFNLTTEFITVNQARALRSLTLIAAQTAAKSTAWKPSGNVTINVPTATAAIGTPLTLTLNTAGLDLSGARIVWEARDQDPDYGSTFTLSPKNPGEQWVEVEITWPDGRRMFGVNTFNANAPVITWVEDAVPAGADINGNEAWTWVTGSPAPQSGTKAHQSAANAGLREHGFLNAWSPLTIATGDTMFVWVYLDPAAMPDEIMVHWNDGSSWEHRAYWGANKIGYGTDGTAGRMNMGALPAGGGWVKLTVPASAVGLEGKSVTGMCFSAFGGGKVTWDAAGRTTNM